MQRQIIQRLIRCISNSTSIIPRKNYIPQVIKVSQVLPVVINNNTNNLVTNQIYNNNLDYNPYDDPLDKYKNKTYNLECTSNVCHIDHWELSKDFITVCQTLEVYHVRRFHDNYVKNYANKLDEYSKGTRTFYDLAWRSTSTIKFDVYHRFMNYNFREILYINKNVSKELIQWFMSLGIIDKGHYHCALNTLCCTGGFETAKIMNEVQPFDFKWKPENNEYHLDYFRSAASNNHLEMAKWLYKLDAHKDYYFGYNNIKQIVNERANKEVKEWLKTLKEFK